MMHGFRRWRRFHRDIMTCRAILSEVVRRIINVAHPDEILLFGSAARGQLRRDSDLDLLVIKDDVEDVREEARDIYAQLFGVPVPIDIIVASHDDVERARREPWTFLGNVMREAKCLYRADGDDRNEWRRATYSRRAGNGNGGRWRY